MSNAITHLAVKTLPLLCLLATQACCTKDIPPPTNQIKDIGILKAAVEARVEQFKTARFKKVVLDYYGKERIKVRQLILVKPPGNLRVHTKMPASEEIISLLVANDQTFSMHKRDTNQYYTGRPTRESVNQLLPLNLSPKDVVHVMLGGAPWDRFINEGNRVILTWNRETGRYHVETKTKIGGKLQMEIRHTDFAVISLVETNKKSDVIYAYTTKSWKRHGLLSLPDFRRFIWPAKNLDFSIDVGETQLNMNLPDTLFEFSPPAGSTVIPIGPQ